VNGRNFAILVAWTLLVIVVTGAALFLFTYGDCFDNEGCKRVTNRNAWIVIGSGFVVYWLVFITLVRKWNRDVQ
jgi:quinol-cytochrome oxidoreductase complex cytochrome b subunit